jgi:hypothetical protein
MGRPEQTRAWVNPKCPFPEESCVDARLSKRPASLGQPSIVRKPLVYFPNESRLVKIRLAGGNMKSTTVLSRVASNNRSPPRQLLRKNPGRASLHGPGQRNGNLTVPFL